MLWFVRLLIPVFRLRYLVMCSAPSFPSQHEPEHWPPRITMHTHHQKSHPYILQYLLEYRGCNSVIDIRLIVEIKSLTLWRIWLFTLSQYSAPRYIHHLRQTFVSESSVAFALGTYSGNYLNLNQNYTVGVVAASQIKAILWETNMMTIYWCTCPDKRWICN